MLLHGLLVVGIILSQNGQSDCFNIDDQFATIYTAHDDYEERMTTPHRRAMFGFAVTQHYNRLGQTRILVGSPRANTSQPQIIEGGAVYDCSLNGVDPLHELRATIFCSVMTFNDTGNKMNHTSHEPMEAKGGQWFGATLVSAKNKASSSVMACAPRYQYFTSNSTRRLAIGMCYHYDGSDGSYTAINPLKQVADYYANHNDTKKDMEQISQEGKGQYGFSSAMSKTGETVVGVPGSYGWSGRVFLHSGTVVTRRSQRSLLINEYFGYSVAYGNFNDSGGLDVVVGSTRGGHHTQNKASLLTGSIRVLGAGLHVLQETFEGAQIGQNLGYSVVTGDFNADGLDDIAAGAPFYSAKGSYDTGRVLILVQKKVRDSGKRIIYKGKNRKYLEGNRRPGEMFGLALAVVGDINKDGYTDLAVGAPYGGSAGQGAVYIFHGSQDGLKHKMAQMIDAASISKGLRTFGFSLSGGVDMDNNGFPDITVGAYASDSVVQLWTRPVLRVYVKVLVPTVVKIEHKNFSSNGIKCAGFELKLHYRHEGNENNATTKLDMTVHLDADRTVAKRANFVKNSRTQMSFSELLVETTGENYIGPYQVCLMSTIRDKLSPIIVEMRYVVTSEYPGRLMPVFDVDIQTTVRSEVIIEKNCGPDRKCVADLSISAHPILQKTSETFTFYHGTPTLNVKVRVENLEPDGAYEATVKVTVPPGVQYDRVYNIHSILAVRCSPLDHELVAYEQDAEERNKYAQVILCHIGNPLPGKQQVDFTLQFGTQNVFVSADQLVFGFRANSSNPENDATSHNNWFEMHLPVRALTPLLLSGTSKPEQILIAPESSSANRRHAINRIIHVYEVENLGPSTVKTAEVNIVWPSVFPPSGELFVLQAVTVHQDDVVSSNCSILHAQPDTKAETVDVSRRKRSVQFYTEKLFQDTKFNKKVLCNPGTDDSWCSKIKCNVGTLKPDKRAIVTITAHLSDKSLKQLSRMTILVTSGAQAQVNSVPYNGISKTFSQADTVEFTVKTLLATKGAGQIFKWWPVAVGIICGIVFLAIVIFILYKIGFFKRKQFEFLMNSDDDANDEGVKDKEDDKDDDEDDADGMLAQFAQGEAGNRNSRIDTVNRKLIFQNGVSISIEDKQ